VNVNVGNAHQKKKRHMTFYVETLNWKKSWEGGGNSTIILKL